MTNLIMFAVNTLFAAIPPSVVKKAIRAAATNFQSYVEGTENKVDDLLVPAIELVLLALEIPNPDGEIEASAELKKLFGMLKEQKNVFLDFLLDEVEDHFAQGSTADQIAEKAAGLVRAVLNVPDND